jgi:hypothetical protein
MKLLFLLTVFSTLSFAKTYRVNDLFCGEVDPFIVGDACLLSLENGMDRKVVVYDFDLFTNEAVLEQIQTGSFVELDLDSLTRLEREEVIDEIRFFSSVKKNQIYEGDLYGLKSLEKSQTFSMNLSCEAKKVWSTYMITDYNFTSTILGYGQGFYELVNVDAHLTVWNEGYSHDPLDVWAKASYQKKSVLNKTDYRPIVYKGYLSFNLSYYQSSSFGNISFVISPKDLIPGEKFTAYAIMSSIDDHWGGTIPMTCEAGSV